MKNLFQIAALVIALGASAGAANAMGGQHTTGEIMTESYNGR